MSILVDFFAPYVRFLHGAAYNIQQNTEGLGIHSSHFLVRDATGNIVGSYWSPGEAAVTILGILVLYYLGLILLVSLATYILGRMKGVFITMLLLAVPGIFNVFGLFPDINYVPDEFIVGGTGVLGSPWGMLPLLLMALLTGWSVVIVLSDVCSLGERFRHYYDHLWYVMVIIAGIYFVDDLSAQENLGNLKAENQSARQASAYLLEQVRDYQRQCQVDSSLGAASCDWASRVQQLLNHYAARDERTFHLLGPKSSADVYSAGTGRISLPEILQIRREIMAYNNSRCPVDDTDGLHRFYRMSDTCQLPPAQFCTAFPDPFEGDNKNSDASRFFFALAVECIVPSLVRSRKLQEKQAVKQSQSAINKHYRWMFFMLLSAIAGGKVANSTSRAAAIDKRNKEERQRLWRGVRRAIGALVNAVAVSGGYGFAMARHMTRAVCKR
ncbi:hypothetical protein HBA54_15765 [Pelagibius litoralis]|uniref:Uncharacterized protein n=1 Tax=Pelagibius litoralis TaxID=374515 RepID=A0A967K9R8_9PROT|nr:hypothetical protein [Pelagibius litoralis]NIA70062.1 hypothetical protein [Pelagibius litoralis]